MSDSYKIDVTRKEMVSYREEITHKNCGGVLEAGKTVLTSKPPKYPHICKKCGERVVLWERYPRLVLETRSGR